MTFMTFLKYFFLSNLVTSNSPDFSTCLAVPFSVPFEAPPSSVHSLKCQCFMGFRSRKTSFYTLSLVFHFHGFNYQLCADYSQRHCISLDLFWTPDASRCSTDISNSLCPQLNPLPSFPNVLLCMFPLVNDNIPVASKPGCHS